MTRRISFHYNRGGWDTEGTGAIKDVYNPVMIAMYSVLFDYLMEKVVEHQKMEQAGTVDDSDGRSQPIEEEGVYYRFGGSALYSMLHLRYNHLKSADVAKQEKIKNEIAILKAMQCYDKQHIPHYLQHRDKGFMYFPAPCFIPFIRNVDKCVLEFATESSLAQYGSKVVEVATENLKRNNDLEMDFNTILKEVYNNDSTRELVHVIYTEFTRKL